MARGSNDTGKDWVGMHLKKHGPIEHKGTLALTTALTAIAIVVALLCFAMVERGDDVMVRQTRRYLAEVSEQVSSRIRLRMTANVTTMEAISENLSLFAGPAGVVEEYIACAAQRYPFHGLSMTDASGQLMLENGGQVDLSGYPAIQEALGGTPAIGDTLCACPEGDACIFYAVPNAQGMTPTGALVAWVKPEVMEERLLGIETFGGKGFSHIIDLEGNFILRSSNSNAILTEDNFFESLKERGEFAAGDSIDAMRAAMHEGRSGYLEYTLDGAVHETMNYVPINDGSWFLLCVVPTAVYADQMHSFTGFSVLASFIIAALFLLLIACTLYTYSRKNREITRIAYEDPVTGGFTAARFALALGERQRQFRPYAFISADLRKFKLVNDFFGSVEGDRVLRYVHNTIVQALGAGEFTSRIASDRFDIVFSTTDEKEIERRLVDISEAINAYNDLLPAPYYLPVDYGIYIVKDPKLDVVTIRDRANTARKKNKTANVHELCKCMFYNDMERLRLQREKEMENGMEQALRNGEFVVHLQPKVSLEDGKTVGAEALVRWQDPERGMIPPSDFISFFERNGFIRELDMYVFEEVCKVLRRWIDEGREPIPVSVNMSQAHLHEQNFLAKYKAIQERYGIPAHLLEIELTETLVFENLEYLKQVVEQIHAMGFLCSLDDFGSGYSSLNVLKEVSVDTLKLDRAFFSKEDDQRGEQVVESVVGLGQKLGMTIVSEGVETIPQVEFLRSIHCDAVQGYVFSKPVSIQEFEYLTFGRKKA